MTGIAARHDSGSEPLFHDKTAGRAADGVVTTTSPAAGRALAVARVALGWVFLWAFLDKLAGFGRPTPHGRGWLDGASPTAGYLKGVGGPLGGAFKQMSGHAWADWLFMGGLAGLAIALILGIGLRAAAVGGVLLLGSLWASSLPLEQNPFLDMHLVYLAMIIALAFANAGDHWGLGRPWARTALVRRLPILR